MAGRIADRMGGSAQAQAKGTAVPPAPINRLFYRIFRLERGTATSFRLPFGSSIPAVLEKS